MNQTILDRIQNLLQRQLFWADSEKEKITNALESFSDDKCTELLHLLEQRDAAQTAALAEILRLHPELEAQIHGLMRMSEKIHTEALEQKSAQDDATVLAKMEEALKDA